MGTLLELQGIIPEYHPWDNKLLAQFYPYGIDSQFNGGDNKENLWERLG
ncbi:MAG: hypothetical protein LIO79_10200 [Rikenellaceae bacterium]|nr:hypothetical protein [Rikenellaceae bacterium]